MIAIFPEIQACVQAGDIEKLAVLVRMYFAGEKARHPKINIKTLLLDFGLTMTDSASSEWATLVVVDEKGTFKTNLLIDPYLPPHEKNFLLGHMLGHFLFDVQPKIAGGEFLKSGYREESSPLLRYEKDAYASLAEPDGAMEKRADQFAAALLLPKAMFLRAHEKLADIKQVARFFGVSLACAERRLQHLNGPLPSKAPKHFAKQVTELYQSRQPQALSPQEKPKPGPAKEVPGVARKSRRSQSALKKIRELAKKIDQSVDS